MTWRQRAYMKRKECRGKVSVVLAAFMWGSKKAMVEAAQAANSYGAMRCFFEAKRRTVGFQRKIEECSHGIRGRNQEGRSGSQSV